jgi:tetratricopeptide (TPR) repeat protein
MLGNVAIEQGDEAAARAHLEEALAIGRELGDRPVIAGALSLLGNLASRQKAYDDARRFREESLAIWQAVGCRGAVMHTLGALGHIARAQGEFGQARVFYGESLRLRQESADMYLLIASLEDFAELAAAEQQWARMTRLLGAAQAQREAAGKPLLPRDRTHYETSLRDARSALAEDALAAAWAEGQALSLEQAIAAALELPDLR